MKAFLILALFSASCHAFPQRQSTTCASVPSFLTADRIVGGQAASAAIPWQVSVRQGQTNHFCGGTILDSKTVLCAAHCFQTQDMSGYFIMAGSTDRTSGGQIIEIEKGIWNSAMPYNSQTSNNDIVILKLKSALTFNSNVQAACLPEATYNPVGTKCFVSGWGTQQFGAQTLPTALQWVDVPILTNAKCSQSYNGITSSMICAGYAAGGKDSCQGDSGGPLVCSNNGKAVITGVVSFGQGCAAANFPGVYARVTTFLTWIKANMETTPAPQPPAPAPQPPAPAPQPPAPAPQPPAPAPTTCAIPEYSKDEFCDDENNTPECNYDNGACCTDTSQTYCTKCECKQNQSPAPQPPAPAPQPPAPAPQPPAPAPTTCAVPQYSTDEFCDDENNTAACNYDNGACCTDTSQMYCTVCECKQNSG